MIPHAGAASQDTRIVRVRALEIDAWRRIREESGQEEPMEAAPTTTRTWGPYVEFVVVAARGELLTIE